MEIIIQNLIRQQRPYYLPQGNPIKGIDDQYWLVFKHRDADNLLQNIISILSFKGKQVTHKALRIDSRAAKIFTYSPKQQGDVPSPALLRTANRQLIEQFLERSSLYRRSTDY